MFQKVGAVKPTRRAQMPDSDTEQGAGESEGLE